MKLTKGHPLRSRWVQAAIVILAIDASFDHSLEVRAIVGAVLIVCGFVGGKLSARLGW